MKDDMKERHMNQSTIIIVGHGQTYKLAFQGNNLPLGKPSIDNK
jgi:hypothetical protein